MTVQPDTRPQRHRTASDLRARLAPTRLSEQRSRSRLRDVTTMCEVAPGTTPFRILAQSIREHIAEVLSAR